MSETARRPPVVTEGIGPGAVAGLLAGLVLGAAMLQLGAMPTIASVLHSDSVAVGLVVQLAASVLVGIGFGLLVWRQRPGTGDTVLWGLAYGSFWWFLGPLTLLPLLLGHRPDWRLAAAQGEFAGLVGYLVYGGTAGFAFALLRDWRRAVSQVRLGRLSRGVAAGLLAAWLLSAALGAQHQPLAVTMGVQNGPGAGVAAATALLGAVAGAVYVLLFPPAGEGAGTTLIRGMVYGFLFWVVAALTALPLAETSRLAWSAQAARSGFVTLPGYLLFGACLAVFDRWLRVLGGMLFSDAVGDDEEGGAGARVLRALGGGAMAGVVGGVLFTWVMVEIGFLGTVARLVGSRSPLTGLAVHLGISVLIGASYGLLFRRQSDDLGSALGWGMAYGFFWWVLGGITLLPVWLGGPPQWTAAGAAAAFPSLVGHLAYGAGLGVTFHLLESRFSPWWISRNQREAALVERRRAHLRSSAPALWSLTLVIALTVPLVLGGR
jgi:uncharacterized membrane protein YagU involved in acid resistance